MVTQTARGRDIKSPETFANPFLHFNARTEEEMGELWSKKQLLYKGLNLFEFYVNNKEVEDMALKDRDFPGSEACHCFDHLNPEDRPYVQREGQEVFFAYDPVNDVFVSGWDIFNDEGGESATVHFRLDDKGFFYDAEEGICGRPQIDDRMGGLFYSKDPRKGIFQFIDKAPKEEKYLYIRLD